MGDYDKCVKCKTGDNVQPYGYLPMCQKCLDEINKLDTDKFIDETQKLWDLMEVNQK